MGMRRPAQVLVIGDSDAEPSQLRLAEAVGALIGRLGLTLVTGGRGGVMEAASRGAASAGATTVSIVPSTRLDDANPWSTVVIPTGLGHARNAVTALAGDVVIVIGGGAGTLSEIAFAWMHGRPILTLCGSGGWAEMAAAHPPDGRQSSTITPCPDLAALEAALENLPRSTPAPTPAEP
jgi:uncharacterized protein (TIGR00725 family)